jgi:hypothetical protein
VRGLGTSGTAENKGSAGRGDLLERIAGWLQGRTRSKVELLIAVRARAKRGLRGVSALGAAAAMASQ